ncbi:BrnT family toxin [Pseudomonas xanthosomatis]|uniref:BrnT family toxin n=1 Tax=Pseudomonas fakonensis TaxID=2842355 RepID=A0ABX8N1D9_9PSED|nr:MULTISPECIES: BrnT family toxin [Pseudomonas]QXH45591.1 BrnT family toxin [Pseudomonas xanthosomatis]QXH50176.1 BrnT family toxin [Pseudomonas fakonensis]
MQFEWDEDKNRLNIRKHGLDFNDVPRMFQRPMLVLEDDRFIYDETRWIAMGWLDALVGVVVYTERQGDVIRIISARRATEREVMRYAQTISRR